MIICNGVNASILTIENGNVNRYAMEECRMLSSYDQTEGTFKAAEPIKAMCFMLVEKMFRAFLCVDTICVIWVSY